jgi:antitoxin component YwqK of YwqJK toxin-antitoxin module
VALRSLLTAVLALLLGLPVPVFCGQEGVGYYPSGRVQWEYLYQQGEVREARWYDESGRLSARTSYAGGQATTSEGYRSDGSLAWRGRFLPDGHQEVTRFDTARRPQTRYLLKGDQPDGVSITYYPSGRMRQTVLFRNGILHGPAQTFAEEGHLESEYSYRDGKLDGVLRSYAADGRLLAEQHYVAGVLQEQP